MRPSIVLNLKRGAVREGPSGGIGPLVASDGIFWGSGLHPQVPHRSTAQPGNGPLAICAGVVRLTVAKMGVPLEFLSHYLPDLRFACYR